GDDGFVYIGYIFFKKTYHLCILTRQTVASGVGDVDHLRSGLYNGLYYFGQVFIICPSGILSIKLYLLDKATGKFNGFDCTLKDSIRSGSQLMLYVISRDPYSGMYS